MNNKTGNGNPLIKMNIASTGNPYHGYKAGTFFGKDAKLRSYYDADTLKYRGHQGIDFAAESGTPVYAMYGGKIIRAYSDAPNKNVDGSFGNLLVIRSTINGQQVDIWYCHLNYGTPFASNPLLGRIYQVNDQVYQGDLIGYSGKTGNATDYEKDYYHFIDIIGVSGKFRSS